VNNGDWGRSLTRQQQAFQPFGLDSYNRGDLDFEIQPRPIVPDIKLSPDERRALMEQGDRGYMPRAKVVEALGGNPEEDIPAIDAEQATVQAMTPPRTVDELTLALQGNGQQLPGQQGVVNG
jgi:hypothetical protein